MLMGLLAVAIAQTVVLWLTRPEPPPEPIEGLEFALTGANFRNAVLEQDGYVLVDFWYEHCPPCRRMEPVISHLSLNYRDQVAIGRVDVEEETGLTEQFGVEVFPTLLLFHHGLVVDRWEGYGGLKEVSRWIDKRRQAGTEAAPRTSCTRPDADDPIGA